MYEIGFLTIGRGSIFWIAFILFVNSFGLLIIFFSVFGANCGNLFKQLSGAADDDFGSGKIGWILGLAVLCLPFVLRKEMAELKLLSIILFSCALSFVIVNVLQLAIRGNEFTNIDEDLPNIL